MIQLFLFIMTSMAANGFLQKGKLLQPSIYTGGCSNTFGDTVVYGLNDIGRENFKYVSRFSVGIWLRFQSVNLNIPNYITDQWSYGFVITDNQAESFYQRILSLGNNCLHNQQAMKKETGNIELQLVMSKDETSGLGPTLYQQLTDMEDVLIDGNWIYFFVGVDYDTLSYNLKLYDTEQTESVLEILKSCPDLTNCNPGPPNKPYLYRPGLQIYPGSSGTSTNGVNELSFCGQTGLLQLYPNIVDFDIRNINFLRWGINDDHGVALSLPMYAGSKERLVDYGTFNRLIIDLQFDRNSVQVDEIVSNVEEVLDVFLSEEEELVEEVTEEEQEEVNSYSIYDDISSYDIRQAEYDIFIGEVLSQYDQSDKLRLDVGKFTLSFWIKLQDGVLNFVPLKYTIPNGAQIFQIGFSYANVIGVYQLVIISGVDTYYSTPTFSKEEWHKVVLSFFMKKLSQQPTNQYMDMYIDGQLFTDVDLQVAQLISLPGIFFIGDGSSQLFTGHPKVSLSQYEIFMGGVFIIHNRLDSDCETCTYSISNGFQFNCIECQVGYFWDPESRQCIRECLPSQVLLKEKNICRPICNEYCQDCTINDPTICIECKPPRVLDQNKQCVCMQGFQNTCTDVNTQSEMYQVGKYFSFKDIEIINSGIGIRVFIVSIPFSQFFTVVPTMYFSIIYMDLKSDAQYFFEITNIQVSQFILQVTVKGETIIKNFGIQYVAFIVNDQIPMFLSGSISINEDTPLGTGTGLRAFSEVVGIVGWPIVQTKPKILLTVYGQQVITGTLASIKVEVSVVETLSFGYTITTEADGVYQNVLLGWLAYSDIFEEIDIQFSTTQLQQISNDPINGQNRFSKESFTFADMQIDYFHSLLLSPYETAFTLKEGFSFQLEVSRTIDDLTYLATMREFGLALVTEFNVKTVALQMKCSLGYCQICGQSPYDCLQCRDQSRTLISSCFSCDSDYYIENDQCKQCLPQCSSCVDDKVCTSCNTINQRINLPAQNCPCVAGYFDVDQSLCQKCANQCKTCVTSNMNCLDCSSADRNNDCSCPKYSYDDQNTPECQLCQPPCIECSFQGCISCLGNKVLNGFLCECPNGGTLIANSQNCNSCLDIVLNVQLSDDLLQVKVEFSQGIAYISNEVYFNTATQLCKSIIKSTTYQLLGELPECFLSEAKQILTVSLGVNPTIVKDDNFEFETNSLKANLDKCLLPLQYFVNPKLVYPIISPIPKAFLKYPENAVTLCEDIEVSIDAIKFDGRRGFQTQEWSLQNDLSGYPTFQTKVMDIIDKANQNLDQMLRFPKEMLQPHVQLQIQLKIVNFQDSSSFSSVTIQIYEYQRPYIHINQESPIQISIRDYLFLTAEFKVETCNPETLEWTTDLDSILLKWRELGAERFPAGSNALLLSAIVQEPLTGLGDTSLVVQPLTGSTETSYSIEVAIFYPKGSDNQLTGSSVVKVFIQNLDLIFYIDGGDRMVSQSSEVKMQAMVWDPNQEWGYNEGFDNVTILWQCSQLGVEEGCLNSFNEPLVFTNSTLNFTLENGILQPFSTYTFTISLLGDKIKAFRSSTLFVTDLGIPSIKVDFPAGILQRKTNLYEQIDFKFILPQSVHPDQVNFNYKIIANNEIILSSPFFYTKLLFQPYDYFPNLENDLDITLCLSTKYQTRSDAAQSSYKLTLNAPPKGGTLSVSPQSGQALSTDFVFTADGWKDQDQPLTYKFLVYLTKDLYLQDIQEGEQQYLFELSSMSQVNSLTTKLPSGDLLVVCQVGDSLTGYVNVTLEVPVTSTLADDIIQFKQFISDIEKEVDTTTKILMLLEVSATYSKLNYIQRKSVSFEVQVMLTYLDSLQSKPSSLYKAQWIVLLLLFYYKLQSLDAGFLSQVDLDAQLDYLDDQQNNFRSIIAETMENIKISRRLMQQQQDLGDLQSSQMYFAEKGKAGYLNQLLFGLFDIADTYFSKLQQDIPQEFKESEQEDQNLLDNLISDIGTQFNRRLLTPTEIVALREMYNFTQLQSSRVHTIYKRFINLIHLLGDLTNEFLGTNHKPILFSTRSSIGIFYTYIFEFEVISRDFTYFISYTSQLILNSPTSLAYDDKWKNIEDQTEQDSLSQYAEQSNGQDEIAIKNDDNILTWEMREGFSTMPKPMEAGKEYLYHLSIIMLPVNPYFWDVQIYNYSHNLTYNSEQAYFSPQVTFYDATTKYVGLNLNSYQLSVELPVIFNNESCVSIVTNFTQDKCRTIKRKETTLCNCDYISDVTVLPQWSIDMEAIQLPDRLDIATMYEHMLGQVILLKSLIFIFFMLVSICLDMKSANDQNRIDPSVEDEKIEEFIDIEDQGDEGHPDKKINLGDKTIDISMDETYAPKKESRVKHKNRIQHQQSITDEKNGGQYQGQRNKQVSISKFNPEESKSSGFEESEVSGRKIKTNSRSRQSYDDKKLQVKKSRFNSLRDEDEETEGKEQKQEDLTYSDAVLQYEFIVRENIDLGMKTLDGSMVFGGIWRLHELISIFIYYDPVTSRFVRCLTLYMKLIVMLAFSSVSFKKIETISWILFTVFMGEFCLFFIKMIKAELGGSVYQKMMGFAIGLFIIFAGWVILLTKADGMIISDSNEWAFNFIIAYLLNTFVIDPILVVMKLLLYPWSIKQIYGNNISPIVYLVFFMLNQADICTYYKAQGL